MLISAVISILDDFGSLLPARTVTVKFLGLKLNLFLVNRSGFDNLLQDDVFVDYLNKFMALPVFGQRMIYRKKQDKAGLNGQIQFVRWFFC